MTKGNALTVLPFCPVNAWHIRRFTAVIVVSALSSLYSSPVADSCNNVAVTQIRDLDGYCSVIVVASSVYVTLVPVRS